MKKATKVSNFEIRLFINNTTLTADELTSIIERAIDKEGVIAEVYAVTNIIDDNTATEVFKGIREVAQAEKPTIEATVETLTIAEEDNEVSVPYTARHIMKEEE